jgi:hypothetical protein
MLQFEAEARQRGATMQTTLVTIPAHFDGKAIQLDVDIALKPNARLLVTVLSEDSPHTSLVREAMQLSQNSLAAIWDNEDDAAYDHL